MKNHNRRKFLLTFGSLSLVTLTGCDQMIQYLKMKNLESKIKEVLESGNKLTLRWDCGGDEAIISSFINGTPMDYQDELAEELDLYLINFLELPSAGEFSMEGTGEVIYEDGNIYLICESIMHGYADYSEEGEDLGWIEVNKKEEAYSGKRKLFE